MYYELFSTMVFHFDGSMHLIIEWLFFSGSGGKKGQKGHGGKGSNKSKRKAPDELWNEGLAPCLQNPLTPFLVDKLPTSNNLDDPSLEVLCLLRTLHALNRYWGSLFEGKPKMYFLVR